MKLAPDEIEFMYRIKKSILQILYPDSRSENSN